MHQALAGTVSSPCLTLAPVWILLNILQAFVIAAWTVFCSLLTWLMLLVTWRRTLTLYVVARFIWSPVLLGVAGVRVRAEGLGRVEPGSGAIYVANHASLWDIPAIVRVIPVPLYFIAKKELRKIPFLGWTMTAVGMIFIDRTNKATSMASMREAGQRVAAGCNVISFPEGTRSKTGEIGLFRRGTFTIAREGRVDLVPVGISGARSIMASGSFRLRPGTIRINIGERITPSALDNLTVDEMAARLRENVLVLKAAAAPAK